MKKLMLVLVTLAFLFLLFPFPNATLGSGEAYAQECTELTNNMVITQDTTFNRGGGTTEVFRRVGGFGQL